MADEVCERSLFLRQELCQNRCYTCISPAKKSTVVKCNSRTWTRFLEFVLQWQNLEGDQAELAVAQGFATPRTYRHTYTMSLIHCWIRTALDCSTRQLGVVDADSPSDAEFHRICYARWHTHFTSAKTDDQCKKLEIAMPPYQDREDWHHLFDLHLYTCRVVFVEQANYHWRPTQAGT